MREPAAADRMGIFASEERRACGRAHGYCRVVIEAQAMVRKPVDVGRGDLAAERAEVRIPEIIEQDHDDIGRAVRCARGRRPPRFGISKGLADAPFE